MPQTIQSYQVYPSQEMLSLADSINSDVSERLISLDAFLNHWRVDYPTLARLTQTSVSNVKTWFSERQRNPTFEQMYRLTLIHHAWMKRSTR